MNELELCEKILIGIFSKNHELREIDDSIFIQLIKAGIDEAAKGDKVIYDNLLEYAIMLYTTDWLEAALEDKGEPDLETEKSLARKEFLKCWGD
ncbi:MAG: hypothetical protein SD837_07575 [Candidatus Electrothrix scaldis]|jgi:hypothetical protein|nr:MAG: hypothetical protein SD837_07575 [Candidatus Electrothrix sp. GW3-3]